MKNSDWQRPPGCACPEIAPLRDKCGKRWIRCNERLSYEKGKTVAAISAAELFTSPAPKEGT